MLRSPPSTCDELLAQLVAVHRRLVQQAEDGELEHVATSPRPMLGRCIGATSPCRMLSPTMDIRPGPGTRAGPASAGRPSRAGPSVDRRSGAPPAWRSVGPRRPDARCVHWRRARTSIRRGLLAAAASRSWPTSTPGAPGLFEVCDASPYLSRAAKYHGEATDEPCPVCRKERSDPGELRLRRRTWATVSGQAKTEAELARMDAVQEEFTVYAVEVCRSCGWNHLATSYVLGAEPEPGRRPPRSPPADRAGPASRRACRDGTVPAVHSSTRRSWTRHPGVAPGRRDVRPPPPTDRREGPPRAFPRRDLTRRAARRVRPPSAARPAPAAVRRRRRAPDPRRPGPAGPPGAVDRGRTTAARRRRPPDGHRPRPASGQASAGKGRPDGEAAAPRGSARSWRRWWPAGWCCSGVFVGVVYASTDGAQPGRRRQTPRRSIVYYSDGTTEMARLGRREPDQRAAGPGRPSRPARPSWPRRTGTSTTTRASRSPASSARPGTT